MKHIKKFNEDYEDNLNFNEEEEEVGKIIFSGETKSGWKYNVVKSESVLVWKKESGLELTSDTFHNQPLYPGEVLDAAQILHDAVDAYIDGDDSTTESFLKDIMDITEAYDKMKSLEKEIKNPLN
jgi:hypothetical protein